VHVYDFEMISFEQGNQRKKEGNSLRKRCVKILLKKVREIFFEK